MLKSAPALHKIPLADSNNLEISEKSHVFLQFKEVQAKTKRSRSSIYIGMKNGTFPKSIPIGGRSVVWIESDIIAWQNNLVAASKLRLAA
jgi:prophage regulatory protein